MIQPYGGHSLALAVRLPALSLLADSQADEAEERLNDCYQRWRDDPLVVDKWLAVQAPSPRVDTRQRIRRLPRLVRPQNPNKVRALLSTFANAHPIRFHDPSGPGYRFIAAQVMAFDSTNPHITAHLASPLTWWQRYDANRRKRRHAELTRIHNHGSLSNDRLEVVPKSLEEA